MRPTDQSRFQPSPLPPLHDRDRLFRLALAALVLVVFGRSVSFEFNFHDDIVNTVENPYLNPPTLTNIIALWSTGYVGLYIPLTYTFWAGVSRVSLLFSGGDEAFSPVVFHASNLVLHLICVQLVYALLRALCRGPRSALASFAGAALFAVHPLVVEPVAWVTGMKDLLSGALSLAAILAYLKSLPECQCGGNPSFNRKSYALATLLFLLALLAKPSAVAIPGMLFILETGFVAGGSWKRAAKLLLPWCLIGIGIVVLAKRLQPGIESFAGAPLWFRPLVMMDALGFYLKQILRPVTLTSDYGRSPAALYGAGWLQNLGWIALLFVCLAGLVKTSRRRNLSHFALFACALLPYLGLVPFSFQVQSTVADRYTYLALFAVALALARLFFTARVRMISAVAVIALVCFTARTVFHLARFQTEESVYRYSLQGNPGSIHIRFNLAKTLHDENRPVEAAAEYRELIDRYPEFAAAYVNLASIYREAENFADAELAYRSALTIDSKYRDVAQYGLALTLAATGRHLEADGHFLESLRRDPENLNRYLRWARALEDQERFDDAARVYTEAARHHPTLVLLHRLAAHSWLASGDLIPCSGHLQNILRAAPEDVFALNLLAWIRATSADDSLHDAEEAVRLAETACGLTSHLDPAALDTLAAAYAASGRFEDALETLSQMQEAAKNKSPQAAARASRIYPSRLRNYRDRRSLKGSLAERFPAVAARFE